ncbi:MAG: alanine racemase, partial [Actinobacteria bacterium]|nr:alanine racemase [Gemmatimonadota bacterium]NIR35236.1 alanine racemase [Actinomycetota bacterium]NIU72901.1 alanine racemase [Gammaproteobacteria bacterium]NIU18090.1 alanine racemase [Actinomycetota bacterium]NIW36745.1 alanine racemase [Gemmatimonadota bacterium]
TEVAEIAVAAGADWLCVNSLEEATGLREAGRDGPVLVMGYVPLDGLSAVVEHDLRPVVYRPETLERLEPLAAEAGKIVRVHLKVETGTYRQGIEPADLPRFAGLIERSPHLVLEGISTHFANIEDTTDHTYAESQYRRFAEAEETLSSAGQPPELRHAACSAAALLFTRTHLDLVRIGISLYGL